MSSKLIMKRKLDRTEQSNQELSFKKKVEIEELLSGTTPSPSTSTISTKNTQKNKSDECLHRQAETKRIHCDTPPPEPEDLDLPPQPQVNQQNRRLLNVIQLKILELQNELDAFEHDVEAHEDNYINDPSHHLRQSDQISEQDAEALGFAMCAQETISFLQREGIASDSLIYTRLRDALIGPDQPDRLFHL